MHLEACDRTWQVEVLSASLSDLDVFDIYANSVVNSPYEANRVYLHMKYTIIPLYMPGY